eukprot:10876415-Heterocapsa_arctica.AAC.1
MRLAASQSRTVGSDTVRASSLRGIRNVRAVGDGPAEFPHDRAEDRLLLHGQHPRNVIASCILLGERR